MHPHLLRIKVQHGSHTSGCKGGEQLNGGEDKEKG